MLALLGQSDKKKNNMRVKTPRNVFFQESSIPNNHCDFCESHSELSLLQLNTKVIMCVDILNLPSCKLKLDANLTYALSFPKCFYRFLFSFFFFF